MKKKYLLLASISGALVALDQLSKMYIHTQFRLNESVEVLNNFFSITYVRNFGAAFGIFSSSHPTFREIFFLSIPPIALVTILMLLRGVADRDRVQIVALSSIFGGAVGNYIDRLRFRYVIDFLDFHFKRIYTWPAFNVADSAIVCGVGVLMLLMFLRKEDKKTQKAPDALHS